VRTLPPLLARYQAVLDDFARERGLWTVDVQHALGFELIDPPEEWIYDSTPVNSLTFGATGGDGIHYGYLTDIADGPVVLTVPLGDNHNIVVGASADDFLRMAYYRGFSWLEELAYDWDAGVKEYALEAADTSPVVIELLPYLRGRMDLQPIPDLPAHLAGLQERYLGLIRLRHRQ
jgi:hypothetical protein